VIKPVYQVVDFLKWKNIYRRIIKNEIATLVKTRVMEEKTAELIEDLFWFARTGGEAELINIIEAYPDSLNLCNEQGCNILHMICANNNLDLLKVLKDKFDISLLLNKPNLSGSYPIHWAVLNGHFNMVGFLIEIGADCKALNSNGESPIEIALRNNDHKTTQLLENFLSQNDSSEI
jgi:uncharacterized protein